MEVYIEFGEAELCSLDKNSLYLKFSYTTDTEVWNDVLDKIRGFWNRKYHKESKEWEVPFSCWEEIKNLYKKYNIVYLNQPPKAKKVTSSEIIDGMDFNGYNLYDYQIEGVEYGINHHNWLLLDEQRTWKIATGNNNSKI